jgi:hypothetical protein
LDWVRSGCTGSSVVSACNEKIGAGLEGEGEMKLINLGSGSCGVYTRFLCVTIPQTYIDSNGNFICTEQICVTGTNNMGGNCSGTVQTAVGEDNC